MSSSVKRIVVAFQLAGEPGRRKLGKPWIIEEFPADGKSHILEDIVGNRVYSVQSSGNDTWFLWNPGVERTALCETLAPDEWRKFWCIEPFMRKPLLLEPGKSRTAAIRLKASLR